MIDHNESDKDHKQSQAGAQIALRFILDLNHISKHVFAQNTSVFNLPELTHPRTGEPWLDESEYMSESMRLHASGVRT